MGIPFYVKELYQPTSYKYTLTATKLDEVYFVTPPKSMGILVFLRFSLSRFSARCIVARFEKEGHHAAGREDAARSFSWSRFAGADHRTRNRLRRHEPQGGGACGRYPGAALRSGSALAQAASQSLDPWPDHRRFRRRAGSRLDHPSRRFA